MDGRATRLTPHSDWAQVFGGNQRTGMEAMVLCDFPERVRRSKPAAIKKLAVATAWFIACGVLATPCVSAQADAATAEPWPSSAGSDYPANVQRPRQPPAQQSSEDFENSRPGWRPVRRQPSRPPEASGVQRASFEADQPSRPVAVPGTRIAQGGPAFRDDYGREYGGPEAHRPPFSPMGAALTNMAISAMLVVISTRRLATFSRPATRGR